MKQNRSCLLLVLVGAMVSDVAGPTITIAFEPTKPIEAVVHTGPGGGSDIFARAIAELMQKEKIIPQRVQVVNKSGGGSAVAMSYLAEKKARHTRLVFSQVFG